MSYHSYSLDEPCGNTCPSIDNIIGRINNAEELIDNALSSTSDDYIVSDLSSALEDLNGLESELEELRRNNSDLREWGKNLAEVVDKIRGML